MPKHKNHYRKLNVAHNADHATIKKAFLAFAWLYHTGAGGGDHDEFVKGQEAYDILRKPLDRAAHDWELMAVGDAGFVPPAAQPEAKPETAARSEKDDEVSGSAQGESGETGSGTETASGTGAADSGTKGNAGTTASGFDTAPHPRNETKKEREKKERQYHGPQFSYESRNYPYTRPMPPPGGKFSILRAMHVKPAQTPHPKPAPKPSSKFFMTPTRPSGMYQALRLAELRYAA